MNSVFGPWDAPVCEGAPVMATPIGDPCAGCRCPIEDGDHGILIPRLMTGGSRAVEPWHRECTFRSVAGCPAHLPGEGSRADGRDGAVQAPRTPQEVRQKAREVWRRIVG